MWRGMEGVPPGRTPSLFFLEDGADVAVGGVGDHGQGGFVDEVAAVGSSDVTAQDPVGGVVDDEFDEPDGLAQGSGLGYAVEALGADGDLVAGVAGSGFGEAHGANFGVNENGVGHDPIGDGAGPSR